MAVTSYIRKSAKGFYSYRRRIPDDCRKAFGKRELQQSLKTKVHSVALTKAAALNAEFERKVASIRGSHKLPTEKRGVSPMAVHEAVLEATDILRQAGIHPSQRPDFEATTGKINDYRDSLALLHDIYVESQTIGNDPRTGDVIYKEEDPSDPLVQAYEMVSTGTSTQLEPTLEMAVEYYLDWSQEKTQRTDYYRGKFEQAQRRATDRLAIFLGNGNKAKGYNTPLREFSRPLMRRYWKHLEAQNPNWSIATFNKELGRLRACFLKANNHYTLELANPFTELKKVPSKREIKDDRRSFSPTELQAYKEVLLTRKTDIKVIAFLMICTGCRTNEIAGLTRGEVKLTSNIPYLEIRHNYIRNVKTDVSERDVPLVGEGLDLLRDYVASLPVEYQPDDPLFPRFGRDGGADSLSQTLNKIIRDKLGIEDPTLTSYSTRHAMTDKLRAVGTPEDLREAMLGRAGESKVARGYGDGYRLSDFQSELSKADACQAWGRYEVGSTG